MKYFLNATVTLLTSPTLWMLVFIPILVILLLGFLAFILILAFALVPQAKGIASWYPNSNGFTIFAYFVSVILCFVYSAVATLILFLIFGQRAEDRAFDVVLRGKCPHLYERRHLENIDPEDPNPSGSSRLDLVSAATMILTLPINLIPVAGQFIYVGANALLQGKVSHYKYFDLKGWGPKRREAFYRLHRKEYLTFGAYKTVLQLIPVLNLVGGFVNAIAAANFAADLEKELTDSENQFPAAIVSST